jgi:RNA polymerase sigma factor (sigma-70 family)
VPPIRTKTLRPVLDRLAPRGPALSDAVALHRFCRHRDGDAFTELVKRYGPLVNGVCRRVLGSRPEADDAVQATFWTLARRAGSIRQPKTLPAWLHAVAYRTARKAAARLAPSPARPPAPPSPDDPFAAAAWGEVRRLLDEEVHRLPPRLRLPVLLCYFEDLTRDEAADRLGWSLSTVKRRLDQARERLRLRLLRRGVGPGLLGAATLLTGELTARVSPTLEVACTRLPHEPPAVAIRSLAVTPPAAAGKWLAAAVVVVALGWGIATIAGQGPPSDPKSPPAESKEKAAPAREVSEPLPKGALARFGTTRYRASTAFWFVDFSRDGRWLASGTEGVEIWDLQTGLSRQLMPVRNNFVPRPRLSPDGRLVAVFDGGPGVHLFDRETGKELRTLGDGKKMYDDCPFTADGKVVVALNYGDTLTAAGFNVGDGKQVYTSSVTGTHDHVFTIWNGRPVFFAIGGERGNTLTVRIVDAQTGKDLRTSKPAVTDFYEPEERGLGFRGPRGSAFDGNRFAIADDLSHFAYRRADGTLGVVALAAGAKPRAVELPANGSTGQPFHPMRIWFAPDGKSVFVSDYSGEFARCDTATGKVLTTSRGHRGGVCHWHFDPAGKVLTTAGQDGLIRRWDLTTGHEIPLAPGFGADVRAAFAAGGTRVVVGDRTGLVEVFETATGKRLHALPRPEQPADWCTFAMSPDGRTLAATRPEGEVLWWDVIAGKEIATTTPPDPKPNQRYNAIDALAFSPDGRRLACDLPNGRLAVLDVAARKELWRVGFPTDPPGADYSKGVAFSADGRHVARGLRVWDRKGERLEYTLQVLDADTGRQVKAAPFSEGKYGKGDVPEVSDLCYTPDGRYLVVLSRSGRVQVRHAETLAEVSAWTAGTRDVLAFGVSPDGRTLLAGDETGVTRLYEIATGKLLATMPGHRGHVATAAMSADGRFLLTGGYDQVAYVWGLKPAAVTRTIRPIDRLTGDSAEQTREAVWALAADPDGPRLLRERFKRAEGPKPESVREWIADLDHPTFAKREAASAALARAGVFVEPAVRRALQANPTAEARERLTKVLTGISHRPTPDDVAHSRAVQALELAGTPAARKVLEEWAAGAEGAWLTVDAGAALERLRKRAE